MYIKTLPFCAAVGGAAAVDHVRPLCAGRARRSLQNSENTHHRCLQLQPPPAAVASSILPRLHSLYCHAIPPPLLLSLSNAQQRVFRSSRHTIMAMLFHLCYPVIPLPISCRGGSDALYYSQLVSGSHRSSSSVYVYTYMWREGATISSRNNTSRLLLLDTHALSIVCWCIIHCIHMH